MRFLTLNKLINGIKDAPHDFRPSTQIFPSINVEKVSRELDVNRKGAERGAKELPSKNTNAYDEIEYKIIERIEDEKKAAQASLEDELRSYSERLASLDFKSQFERVRTANTTSISDFKAEIQLGINQLHGIRDALKEALKERAAFRKKHKIDRAARLTTSLNMTFKLGLIVLLLMVETIVNGKYLAEGSLQGLFGGIVNAFAYAAINIGTSLLLALFAVRLITHSSFFAKLIGALSIIIYVSVLIGINLALAHYREVSSKIFETAGEAGKEVIQRMSTSPFGIEDINSWVLFGIGVIFSLIAFIDGWFLNDPYVGYAGVEKRLREARETYISTHKDNIEELRAIRDEHNDKVEEVSRDLSSRLQEHDVIVTNRSRLISLFNDHQNLLERAANTLITQYREVNTKNRKTKPPKCFSKHFQLSKLAAPLAEQGAWNSEKLSEGIQQAQASLSKQIAEISKAFEIALKRYDDLDKLFPDGQ